MTTREERYRTLMAHLFEAQVLAAQLWGTDFNACETITSAIDEAAEQYAIEEIAP